MLHLQQQQQQQQVTRVLRSSAGCKSLAAIAAQALASLPNRQLNCYRAFSWKCYRARAELVQSISGNCLTFLSSPATAAGFESVAMLCVRRGWMFRCSHVMRGKPCNNNSNNNKSHVCCAPVRDASLSLPLCPLSFSSCLLHSAGLFVDDRA